MGGGLANLGCLTDVGKLSLANRSLKIAVL